MPVGNYKTDSDDNGETTVIQNRMHPSSILNSNFIILHLILTTLSSSPLCRRPVLLQEGMLLLAPCKDNQLLNDQRVLRCFSVRTFLCQLLHTSNVTSGWHSALFVTSGWNPALFFLEFRFHCCTSHSNACCLHCGLPFRSSVLQVQRRPDFHRLRSPVQLHPRNANDVLALPTRPPSPAAFPATGAAPGGAGGGVGGGATADRRAGVRRRRELVRAPRGSRSWEGVAEPDA